MVPLVPHYLLMFGLRCCVSRYGRRRSASLRRVKATFSVLYCHSPAASAPVSRLPAPCRCCPYCRLWPASRRRSRPPPASARLRARLTTLHPSIVSLTSIHLSNLPRRIPHCRHPGAPTTPPNRLFFFRCQLVHLLYNTGSTSWISVSCCCQSEKQ